MITSIIIPAYRESNLLSNLKVVLSRINRSLTEIIVCEAMPASKEIAQASIRFNFKYIVSDVACRAVQMNLGASQASGDILVFLHADVLPPLDFVASIQISLYSGNDFGFFAYHFSPSNRWLDINAKFTHRDGFFAGGGDQIHYMTKAFFEKMNGYDETYCIMEDFDFTRRVKKLQIKPMIINKEATVSARKYMNNSYLRVNLINLSAVVLFYFGAKPERIKQFYTKHIK